MSTEDELAKHEFVKGFLAGQLVFSLLSSNSKVLVLGMFVPSTLIFAQISIPLLPKLTLDFSLQKPMPPGKICTGIWLLRCQPMIHAHSS